MSAELCEGHRPLQGLVTGSSVPTGRSANVAKLCQARTIFGSCPPTGSGRVPGRGVSLASLNRPSATSTDHLLSAINGHSGDTRRSAHSSAAEEFMQ